MSLPLPIPLWAILVTPVLGIILLVIIPENKNNKNVETFKNQNQTNQLINIRKLTLAVSVLIYIISIWIWQIYDNNNIGYQINEFISQEIYLNLSVGNDGVSIFYVLLTTFLTPICILASWKIKTDVKFYIIIQLIISGLLLGLFLVQDLLIFYVAFEALLIPLFILVGKWGGILRIRATLLLFIYTLAGSLVILVAIQIIYWACGTTSIVYISIIDISQEYQKILWICFFIAFAVKTPLFPVHIWLPRAHAEAPLAGSIILAGTVLKASTYGYIRVLLNIIPDGTNYWMPVVHVICVLTLIFASVATIRQWDIKALVAYSSIAHIAIVTLGIFSNTNIGILGGILLSLAHGVISPAIFVYVGGVLYDRYHTRVLQYYKGLSVFIPIGTTLFFITICCNISTPLSLNWIGELLSLSGVFQQSFVVGFLASFSVVLSACYSIWFWARISGGQWNYIYMSNISDITRREIFIIIPLISIGIIFGIVPNVIIETISFTTSSLIYTIA